MPDSSLLQLIKRIVKETMDAEKLCDYVVGTVVSENPLKIKISNSITLDSDFLDVSRNMTDFDVKLTVNSKTETATMHNSLKCGDAVLMLRKNRGKRYAVIDRVVSG